MCYVVRPMVVVSVLNMERHFLSLFPEQYSITTIYIAFTLFFLKTLFILFLERGEEEGKERETNINVWLPLTWSPLGTQPALQACAPTCTTTPSSPDLVGSPLRPGTLTRTAPGGVH